MSLFRTYPKPPRPGDTRTRRGFFLVKCINGERRWFGFDARVQMRYPGGFAEGPHWQDLCWEESK